MQTTSYADLRDIEADLTRWRDESAEAYEARASLIARYQRADSDEVRDSLLRLDSEFFDVVELPDGPRMIEVGWRE